MKFLIGFILHPFVLLICLPYVWSIGYLFWGTQFLYKPHKFVPDLNNTEENAKAFQAIYGYRGVKYIASLNQQVVENNSKLYDVEDSTKSYRSPDSYW